MCDDDLLLRATCVCVILWTLTSISKTVWDVTTFIWFPRVLQPSPQSPPPMLNIVREAVNTAMSVLNPMMNPPSNDAGFVTQQQMRTRILMQNDSSQE